MPSGQSIGAILSLMLFAAPVAGAAAEPAIEREMLTPEVSVRPVPITATSKPFLASRENLAAHGYVEEEFFLSGQARAYDWVDGTLKIRAVSPPGPYTTRVLVRRPVDPKRFSGNIEVETLNASTGLDITTTMATSGDYIMQQGDVWVGVTSKPLTLQALKRFDPARYADLQWSNPTPVESRCEAPSIIPLYTMGAPGTLKGYPPFSTAASEDGLVWDIYAQLGALLKSEHRGMLLPGFRKPHLFATGYSQSGLIQRTFISGFHSVMRLSDGGPIFDGYLIEVGPAMLRINQCSADILADDRRNRLPEIDVPVINIVSEGDMWLGAHTRQPDVVRPRAGLVTYEIAGASHKSGMGDPGHPTPEEMARAGGKPTPPPSGLILNDMPRGYLSTAALSNLQAWALKGEPPPQGPRLSYNGSEIARDGDGNALGGVRTPWIDVPTAAYQGSLGLGVLTLVGRKTPFSPEKLRALYPSHADYLAKLEASVASSVQARWILPEDGRRIVEKAAAQTAP